eukprot:g4035.t1
MFGHVSTIFESVAETDWPRRGLRTGGTFKLLEKAQKDNKVIRIGRQGGKRPIFSAVKKLIEEEHTGYEAAVINHVLHHVRLNRDALDIVTNANATDATDASPRTRSASVGSTSTPAGTSTNTLSSGDVAAARQLFLSQPFPPLPTKISDSERNATRLVKARLKWLRTVLDGELCCFAENIIQPELRTAISHEFVKSREDDKPFGWAQMKTIIYQSTERREKRFHLCQLLTKVRTSGTDIVQWFQQIDSLQRETRTVFDFDPTNAAWTQLFAETALAQITPAETRLLGLAASNQSATVTSLLHQARQINPRSRPAYTQRKPAKLAGTVLFASPNIKNKDAGGKSSYKKTTDPDPTKDDDGNDKKPSFCRKCRCVHPYGKHKDKPSPPKDATKKTQSPFRRLQKDADTVNKRMSAGKCYNCGGPGHLARDCPKPKKQRFERAYLAYQEMTDLLTTQKDAEDAPKPVGVVFVNTAETSSILSTTATYLRDGAETKQPTLLDTGSAISLAPATLLTGKTDAEAPSTTIRGITGKTIVLPPPRTLTVCNADGSTTPIMAHPIDDAIKGFLPGNAGVLLGRKAIETLRVSIDAHVHNPEQPSTLARIGHDRRDKNDCALLELCAGTAILTAKVKELGLQSLRPIDKIRGADLTSPHTTEMLRQKITANKPTVIFFAPPCAAFSALQRFTAGQRRREKRVAEARQQTFKILRAVAPLFEIVAGYGGHVIVEQPKDSTLPKTQEWTKLFRPFAKTYSSTHDRCRYGGRTRKPTTLHTSFQMNASDELHRTCEHTEKHPPLLGAQAANAAAYTRLQAEAIARVIQRLHRQDVARVNATSIPLDPVPTRGGDNDEQPSRTVKAHQARGRWTIEDAPTAGETFVFLSQKLKKRFLEFRQKLQQKTSQTHEDIQLDADMPESWKKKFRQLHARFATVFKISEGQAPPAARYPPISFKFEKDAKPVAVPEPRWTHADRTIISEWAREKLRSGQYEHAPAAHYACRPHIAPKQVKGEPKDLSGRFDIRICHDVSRANNNIVKAVADYPDPQESIHRASGRQLYISTDAHAQFGIFELANDGTSQSLTVWTPLGKIKPKRLIFGTRNGATYAQAAFRMFEQKLSHDTRENKVMYQDDSLIFAGTASEDITDDTYEKLFRRWKDYLEMCRYYRITLKPSKTTIATKAAEFYGHVINVDGHRQTVKNAEPIKNCPAPTNVSELRSVLGLFNVGRLRIPHFAETAKPLTALLKKGATFEFGEKELKAFETLRDKLASRPLLRPPNFAAPFFVDTDASDDGMGAVIYQRDGTEIRPIAYHSKSWNAAMRRKPVYYREAAALFWGIDKARPYALSSPHTLVARMDHKPLLWIAHSEKGVVSAWRLDKTADIDYKVEYVKGADNVIADALSRYPLLGPQTLAPAGIETALKDATEALGTIADKRVQIYAKAHTDTVARMLHAAKPRAIIKAKIHPGDELLADVTILIPTPEDAVELLAPLLKQSKPAALLIPSDLVQIAVNDSSEIQALVDNAAKITYLATGLTWFLTGTTKIGHILAVTHERSEWASSTDSSLEAEKISLADVYRANDGVALISDKNDGPPRVYVPLTGTLTDDHRRRVVKHAHEALHHLGTKRTISDIMTTYYWPTLKKDVKLWVAACAHCNAAKARRNAAHGTYKPNRPRPILSRWGIDFFPHPAGPILTAIDIDSNKVAYEQYTSRDATNVIEFVHKRIINTFGTPQTIVSDDAQEFLSAEFQTFLRKNNIQHKRTHGYHPEANAAVERNHGIINTALKIAGDATYAKPKQLLCELEFAYGNTPHSSTGISPNEMIFGTNLVSSTHAIAVETPTNHAATAPPTATTARSIADNAHTAAVASKAIADAHRFYDQRQQANMLNRGRRPAEYEIGQRVLIYAPITATTSNRSAKHLYDWDGPYSITNVLAGNIYAVAHDVTGKQYTRSIANIRPWRTSNQDSLFSIATAHDGTTPDDLEIIATRDSNDTTIFHLAKVTKTGDDEVVVHYFGTKSEHLPTAKFKLAYTDAAKRILLHKPRRNENAAPYTGHLSTKSELILARHLRLRPTGRLSHDSLQFLSKLTAPCLHHTS